MSRANDSPEDRRRVSLKIAQAILAFHEKQGVEQFHVAELHEWVMEQVGEKNVAPASADRILRDLRQRGRLDYAVISRSSSLYQFKIPGTLFG